MMDGTLLSKALLCVWALSQCVNGLWVTITALFSITDKAAIAHNWHPSRSSVCTELVFTLPVFPKKRSEADVVN